jgi:hypothetical protein
MHRRGPKVITAGAVGVEIPSLQRQGEASFAVTAGSGSAVLAASNPNRTLLSIFVRG